MDEETRARIADYYEAHELVEFLQITVEDVIERFADEIEEKLDEIDEDMDYREKEYDG